MTMKVLICDGLHESGLELLRGTEGIEVEAPKEPTLEQIAERLPECDAIVVRSRTKVREELLEKADRLRVIARAGTGVDNIDIKGASARGILVMNAPGANAVAAAEHTMALMLALSRHVPQATQSIREGRWDKKRFMGTELYQQTLGVIGMGKIGAIVTDRALGMKMDVLVFDPHIPPEAAAVMGAEYVSLEDLFARSDFITLHTPLTPETRNIVNRDSIAQMKPGVRIINCARGGLVDEEALHEAIVNGRVAGAALDVFAQEPPRDNPLTQLESAIFTPHLGASSFQAQANVARTIATQIIDYLKRGIIRNAVNFPSVSPKEYEKLRPYLMLAERLGSLIGQLSMSIHRMEIEYAGSELREVNLEPLTQTIIKGSLDAVLSEKVNVVNAALILKERQIQLVTSTTSEVRGYIGMITVRTMGPERDYSVSGTVFPGAEPRMVRYNNYPLEAELEGINLLIGNLDKPGVIGFIGSTLGNYQVNIANMHLARTLEGDRAVAIVRVDHSPDPDCLQVLRSHPNILYAHVIQL